MLQTCVKEIIFGTWKQIIIILNPYYVKPTSWRRSSLTQSMG